MDLNIRSEINDLRCVITHKPGIEHQFITPSNLKETILVDKKIQDSVASDGLKEDYKKGKNIKEWVKVGGGTRALSKFNSENCKNIINFFTSKNDVVLDPFAGRTRAIITNELNRKYIGFELTEKYFPQIIGKDLRVYNDDSANMGKWLDYLDYADLVFTCPPYWNMEKYSDNSNDLSTFKTYDKFLDGCNSRLELASQYLKEDGFLVKIGEDYKLTSQWVIDANGTNLIDILKPVINSNSVWKSYALYLIAEYFFDKNEKQKAKDFYNQILNFEKSNESIVIETQKRLNRDFSE